MALLRRFLARTPRPLRKWNSRLVYGFAARVRPTGPDGVVTADVACRRCGYNLRTLHVEARCPECAMPAGASVRGDELIYSDPAWLARIERGAWVLLAGCVGVPVALLGGLLYAPAAAALALGVLAAATAGTWLLTTPDPSGAGETWYGTVRKVARGLPWLVVTVSIIDGLRQLAPTGIVPSDIADALMTVVECIGALAGYGAVLALLAFVRSLAATRITDAQLADHAGRVMLRLTAAGAVSVVALMIGMGRPGATPARGVMGGVAVVVAGILTVLTLVSSVLHLWSFIGFFRVLAGVRHALSVQLELARQLWPPPARAGGQV